MLECLAAGALLVATVLLMPAVYGALRRSARGGLGGAALALGVAFSNLLDPAKRNATEQLDRHRAIAGAEEAERAGGPAD